MEIDCFKLGPGLFCSYGFGGHGKATEREESKDQLEEQFNERSGKFGPFRYNIVIHIKN